ncbi:MAG TPA: ribose-phosphate pyrophosphokinase-like domain-containing protein [Propionibacteriaceae bacterium]|nr:ribose-phosphate pyrophosphokinase-like domain-containing protein [Propionibacteriaceae bacterium]
MTGEITVFSGSAHPEFAEELCAVLGVELSPTRTSRFSNDCLQVQLRANCGSGRSTSCSRWSRRSRRACSNCC